MQENLRTFHGLRRAKCIMRLALILAALPATAYAANDPCVALIPPTGAYQIIKDNGVHVHYDRAKQMFCSSEFDQSSASNNWGFNLDVPGYGSAGADAGSSSSAQSKTAFCSDSSRDLTSVDQAALYRLQGDSTLVAAFVACEQAKYNAMGFAAYTVTAHSTPTTINIVVTPHLSANAVERITSIGLVGAQATPGVDLPPGSPLLPNVARTASYSFTDNTATIVIHTTTGDHSITIARCRSGMLAGTAYATGVTTVQVPVYSTWTWTITVGQAGCHPNCNPDQGDERNISLDPPTNGDMLSDLKVIDCQGNGCQFDDHISVGLRDPSHAVYHIRSRSESIVAHVTATGMHTEPQQRSEILLGNTPVLFDRSFSIIVPSDAQNAALHFNALIVPLSGLAQGPWNGTELFVVDPGSSIGTGRSVTFKDPAPSCDAT